MNQRHTSRPPFIASSSRPSRSVCFLLRLRSVRWAASPPGAACVHPCAHGTRGHRAPGPSRVHCAPSSLRARESGPADRDRRGPRSARRLPPRLNRRRAGGSARRGGRDRRPRLARPSARSGGPHGPPLRETAGSPRRIWAASPRAKNTRPGPRRCAALRLNACTDGAASLQLVPASVAPRRPFRRCALLEHPRAKLRCASRAAPGPTPRVLRSAPSSLHCEREPPLAALALRRA